MTPHCPPQPMPGSPRPRKRWKPRNRLRTDRAGRGRKVRSEPRKKRSPSKKPSVLKRTAFHFEKGRRISCSPFHSISSPSTAVGLDGEEIETGCELKGLSLRRTYG